MPKKLIFNSEQIETLEGYNEILREIKGLLEKATYQAYKAVDNLRVQTYWQIGERIVRAELEHTERAEYGENIIEKLAIDLGFKKRDIYRMVQFYRTYQIMTSLMSQLTWTHYTVLITIENGEERRFYEVQTIQNSWSVKQLKKQIDINLYKQILHKKEIPNNISFPLISVSPEHIFKDTYNFNFLNLKNEHNNGPNFSIAGRQRKVVIDREIHVIDLEFYHRDIPCIILVDLKIGKFKSEYVGQMNKYLNY